MDDELKEMKDGKDKIITDMTADEKVIRRIQLRQKFQNISKMGKTMRICCNTPTSRLDSSPVAMESVYQDKAKSPMTL